MLAMALPMSANGFEHGDLNHDGRTSIKDVTLLINYLLTEQWPDSLYDGSGDGSEPTMGKIDAGGSWTALGTSITYYDGENLPSWVISSGLTKGYVTRVTERIDFTSVTNKGGNGHYIGQTATGSNANSDGKNAATLLPDGSGTDFYTVEYGINDWGMNVPLGTMDDFLRTEGVTLDTKSFYYGYRTLLDRIYEVNPNAVIILCTTRKGHGGNYNPSPQHWYSPNGNGVYLEAFADAVIEIAKYMSLPVCDWFNESNTNDTNIDQNSWWHSWNPGRLHPNDRGSQKMANLLVHTFEKVLSNGASLSGGSSGGSSTFTEADPTVPSYVKNITQDDITAWDDKQSALTFDASPTDNSSNPVTSGGVKAYVDGKASIPIVALTPTNRTAVIEPNNYYLLGNVGSVGSATAAENSLTLSFMTSDTVALSFRGRFTAVADGLTLNLPRGIHFTDSAPEIKAGRTYEFNIFYDVCILTDITVSN